MWVAPPNPPQGGVLRAIGTTPATQEPLSGVGCGNLPALWSKDCLYLSLRHRETASYDTPGWFAAGAPARLRRNPPCQFWEERVFVSPGDRKPPVIYVF